MRLTHLQTRYKHDLSPRQQEVLELIAAGKTNPEIAEALGISLDGAKYHVREIMAKLDVESREEAAREWRRMRSPVGRLRLALPALNWLSKAGVVLAAVGLVAAAAATVAVIAVLSGDAGEPDPVAPGPGESPTVTTLPVSPTPAPSSPDLSQFDPEPIPLDPATEPCEPNRQYVVLSVGGGDLLGACATWDDTWTDELGFVIRVELLGAGTAHYLLPAGAEAMFVPEDHRPSCARPGFTFSLFVLLPTGPRFVDAGGVQGICDGG